ncbi:hypothetical protein RFI_17608 [Reticulomyxa filosa]|uniref:Uncharacterized protein n=1 Tax=Reticulomyxa filosa TaxID=46433 RepID=X6N1K9_RETFI|nr:hypothetical protein RFI_17608 [Reticulomyxa filosa]|eukprot:ETO19624.1 hypothetical protein RFI_17608 [Reticulomyxa filosa]
MYIFLLSPFFFVLLELMSMIEPAKRVHELKIPKEVKELFEHCRCHYIFFHQLSGSLVLLLRKTEESILLMEELVEFRKHLMAIYSSVELSKRTYGRIAVKIDLNLDNPPHFTIESISIGAVKIPEEKCKILCYDQKRAAIVLDTLTVTEKPDKSSKPTNIQKKSDKPLTKYTTNVQKKSDKPLTKYTTNIRVIRLNDLIYQWKRLGYDFSFLFVNIIKIYFGYYLKNLYINRHFFWNDKFIDFGTVLK